MPDGDFDLVDDYWISFVANHKYGRNLRKLSTNHRKKLFTRTDDSDTKGLALWTRPEVSDARLRMYIHHMQQGWPKFIDPTACISNIPLEVRKAKTAKIEQFKKGKYVGFNVSSEISFEDVETLCRDYEVKVVRVGAVGSRSSDHFEFQIMEQMCSIARNHMINFLEKMQSANIDVIVTLDERVAGPEQWQFIASICSKWPNVIGYDLINEPYTECDTGSHFLEVSREGLTEIFNRYKRMIEMIRAVDDVTAVVVEPSFWGSSYALDLLGDELHSMDPVGQNLMVSVHFYEPRALTFSHQYCTGGSFCFPGDIPVYPMRKISDPEVERWDEAMLESRIEKLRIWADSKNITLFIGEIGIGRDTSGATTYMETCLAACRKYSIGSIVYAFRDPRWEKMDYEFGNSQAAEPCCHRTDDAPIAKVVKKAIQSAK